MASLPAILFLGVAALEGLTGLILQQQQTAILDNELGIHESLLNGSKTSSSCCSSCYCAEKRTTLYATAGSLSLETVSWLNPLLALGSQKLLELSDLPNLPVESSWEALQKEEEEEEEEVLSFWRAVVLNALFAFLMTVATVSWLNPLLALGSQKLLELSDLSNLPVESSWEALQKEEEEEEEEENCSSVPSISVVLFLSFWRAVVLNALFAFLMTVATYTGPYLINDFVEYLGGRRRLIHEGFVLVFIFFSVKLIENLSR
jgi:hypothetical protein